MLRTVPAGTLGFYARFDSRGRSVHYKVCLAFLGGQFDVGDLVTLLIETSVNGFSDLVVFFFPPPTPLLLFLAVYSLLTGARPQGAAWHRDYA